MKKLTYRQRMAKKRRTFLWSVFSIAVLTAVVFIVIKKQNVRLTNDELIKKLSAQLVKGLQNDTMNMHKALVSELEIAAKEDNFLVATQDTTRKLDTANLQHLVAGSYSFKRFTPDAQPITAVKYNLPLKQFANSHIGQYLDEYQESLDSLKALEDIQGNYLNGDVASFVIKHFGTAPKGGNTPKTTVKVTADDVSQLEAEIGLIQSFKKDRVLHLRSAQVKAIRLMDYVRANFLEKHAGNLQGH